MRDGRGIDTPPTPSSLDRNYLPFRRRVEMAIDLKCHSSLAPMTTQQDGTTFPVTVSRPSLPPRSIVFNAMIQHHHRSPLLPPPYQSMAITNDVMSKTKATLEVHLVFVEQCCMEVHIMAHQQHTYRLAKLLVRYNPPRSPLYVQVIDIPQHPCRRSLSISLLYSRSFPPYGPYPSPTRTRTRSRPCESSVGRGQSQSRADERGAEGRGGWEGREMQKE